MSWSGLELVILVCRQGAYSVEEKAHKAFVLSCQYFVSGQDGEEEAKQPSWKFIIVVVALFCLLIFFFNLVSLLVCLPTKESIQFLLPHAQVILLTHEVAIALKITQ